MQARAHRGLCGPEPSEPGTWPSRLGTRESNTERAVSGRPHRRMGAWGKAKGGGQHAEELAGVARGREG